MRRASCLSGFLSFTSAVITVVLAWPGAPAQQPVEQLPPPAGANAAKPDDGMEVEARGPVHEAYAKPFDKNLTPAAVVAKKPPPPIPEEPPNEKPNAAAEWLPGYWGWDADRNDFIWISGFWRVPPPGRQWVPGHWAQAANGWQWVSGVWAAGNQDLQYVPEPPPSVDNGPSVPAP